MLQVRIAKFGFLNIANFSCACARRLWMLSRNASIWWRVVSKYPTCTWDLWILSWQAYLPFQQGTSERFDSCDRPCNLKWDPNRFFSPCSLEIWDDTEKLWNLLHAPKIWWHVLAIHEFHVAVAICKRRNLSWIIKFSSRVTLKFDGWC